MSRPERELSKMARDYQQHWKNYTPPSIEVTHFYQDYNDVIQFLTEKILNFIRLNPRLRSDIASRRRFVENKFDLITFNFNEGYRHKFIEPDFEGHCLKFMELLKPVLFDFVKEIGFGCYVFKYQFRLNGQVFEKRESVILEREDETKTFSSNDKT